MILFYNRKTGRIIGKIDGRVHSEDHLKMWYGTKEENERIIINWLPVAYFDKHGKKVEKDEKNEDGSKKAYTADFMPDHTQSDILVAIEKDPHTLSEYKIDLKTKQLVKQ